MNKSLTYETEDELLKALRQGAAPAFEMLYRQYFRMVAKQTADAGLGSADAEDLFQEVLVVLVRKIKEPEFQLTAKLSTYLFAIARNLILKKASPKAEFSTGEIAAFQTDAPPAANELEDREQRENQLNVVVGYLEALEDDCQQLLKLSFFEKYSQAEIAEKMGYADSFVKVKKHRCLEYLRKQVKTHTLFKHLQNHAS